MKQPTPQPQPTLNLLATFDELAASQPAALAREMAEAGLPDAAIQTAQAELRVILAGMRSAIAEKNTQLARVIHSAQDDRRALAATRKQRELEAELKARMLAWPAERRDAQKKGKDVPPINQQAEHQHIASVVAAYTDALHHQDVRELARLHDNLAADIEAEMRAVVDPYVSRYARARQRTSAQLMDWQRRYLEMLDRPSPDTIERLNETAESTFEIVPQDDGTLRYVFPPQRESVR